MYPQRGIPADAYHTVDLVYVTSRAGRTLRLAIRNILRPILNMQYKRNSHIPIGYRLFDLEFEGFLRSFAGSVIGRPGDSSSLNSS